MSDNALREELWKRLEAQTRVDQLLAEAICIKADVDRAVAAIRATRQINGPEVCNHVTNGWGERAACAWCGKLMSEWSRVSPGTAADPEEEHKAKVREALEAVNAEHGENLRRLAEDDGA